MFLFPAAATRREGGHLHEHSASAPVAREGGGTAGRRAERSLVHLSPRPRLKSRTRAGTRLAARCRPGLRSAGTTRRRGRWRSRRAVARCLEEINGPDGRATASARVGLHRARGRRLDGVRLLDLLRRVPDHDAQPRRETEPPGHTATAGGSPGRPIAASSTTARRARPDGRALERPQEARLVGRGDGRMDRARRGRLRRGRSAPTTRAIRRRSAATAPCAATRRSSCIRTASDGSGCPAG